MSGLQIYLSKMMVLYIKKLGLVEKFNFSYDSTSVSYLIKDDDNKNPNVIVHDLLLNEAIMTIKTGNMEEAHFHRDTEILMIREEGISGVTITFYNKEGKSVKKYLN